MPERESLDPTALALPPLPYRDAEPHDRERILKDNEIPFEEADE